MKPDYHKEKDGLGISHSVTHCCSVDTAHVHKIRRAREKGRTKRSEGGMGQRAGSSLKEKKRRKSTMDRKNTEDENKVERVI